MPLNHVYFRCLQSVPLPRIHPVQSISVAALPRGLTPNYGLLWPFVNVMTQTSPSVISVCEYISPLSAESLINRVEAVVSVRRKQWAPLPDMAWQSPLVHSGYVLERVTRRSRIIVFPTERGFYFKTTRLVEARASVAFLAGVTVTYPLLEPDTQRH